MNPGRPGEKSIFPGDLTAEKLRKKEREPEFELRFPEFRHKNGRDREI